MKDAQARFTQLEVVHLCRNKRCHLDPLKVANGLAGLPFIKYRRSAARCRRFAIEDYDRGPYREFQMISKIVATFKNGTRLEIHAKDWLQSSNSNSPAIFELAHNWYYLKEAIKKVAKIRNERKYRDFRIAEEYLRLVSCPSPAARILAGADRVICGKLKKRRVNSGSPPVSADDKP